ncbi:MAG: hypothetical protein J0L58_06075 [Burkholderiales bacterium]|nr:hypothetical protein [Burkholderiales bacterium]
MAASLQGWLPVAVRIESGAPRFELARLGDLHLTAPFFEESLAGQMHRPFHQLFRRSISLGEAEAWLVEHPGLAPTGFIFHVSRCGSTLVSQLLADSPAHRVLSEPGPVDRVLRAAVDDGQRRRWLRAVLGLLAQPARETERRFFVKFDSWHALHMEQIRACYPEVPCLVLVREPLEVIASHLRAPGAQMVPGMLGYALPGLDPATSWQLPREVYAARVVETLQAALLAALEAAQAAPAHAPLRVIDYARLVSALDAEVWPLFGWRPDAAEREALAQAMQRDAKNPSFTFAPDVEAKRRQASAAVHAAAEVHCVDSYRRLLALQTPA